MKLPKIHERHDDVLQNDCIECEAYMEGFNKAITMLKSEEASSEMDCKQDDYVCHSGKAWADWLELKIKEKG